LNTLAIERTAPDDSVIQYSEGSDATIVCLGFSLSSGEVLQSHLSDRKIVASLFSANIVDHPQWEIAISEATNSKGFSFSMTLLVRLFLLFGLSWIFWNEIRMFIL